jgi:16S rRNA (adenine1518-N6/adenine1519-N6)-dimethyltransferase
VQKEVAERLVAKPGTPEYGPLTVMAQLLSRVEVLRTLPPQAFWPAPKIESSLVRLHHKDLLGETAGEFGRFVRKLFSFRRKTLRKALVQAGFDADSTLRATAIDGTRRAEEFSPEQLLGIFDATR